MCDSQKISTWSWPIYSYFSHDLQKGREALGNDIGHDSGRDLSHITHKLDPPAAVEKSRYEYVYNSLILRYQEFILKTQPRGAANKKRHKTD